jgi:hypothetical protein
MGRAYRMRFVGLQVRNRSAGVRLTARADSVFATGPDSMITMGETYDFVHAGTKGRAAAGSAHPASREAAGAHAHPHRKTRDYDFAGCGWSSRLNAPVDASTVARINALLFPACRPNR